MNCKESISIIIPVKELVCFLPQLLNLKKINKIFNMEVCVVFDQANEQTINDIREASVRDEVKVVLLKNKNTGYPGHAIDVGFKTAINEKIIVIMGDDCDAWDDVPAMIKLLDHKVVVSACRLKVLGHYRGGSKCKEWTTRLGALLLRYKWGWYFDDPTNNFKAYRKETIEMLRPLKSKGFSIGLEIMVKAHIRGMPMLEIQSMWKDESRSLRWLNRVSSYLPYLLFSEKKIKRALPPNNK
jgi:dolichol-phosphate mannosyltransferase